VPLIVFILLNRWRAQKTAGIRGSGE